LNTHQKPRSEFNLFPDSEIFLGSEPQMPASKFHELPSVLIFDTTRKQNRVFRVDSLGPSFDSTGRAFERIISRYVSGWRDSFVITRDAEVKPASNSRISMLFGLLIKASIPSAPADPLVYWSAFELARHFNHYLRNFSDEIPDSVPLGAFIVAAHFAGIAIETRQGKRARVDFDQENVELDVFMLVRQSWLDGEIGSEAEQPERIPISQEVANSWGFTKKELARMADASAIDHSFKRK